MNTTEIYLIAMALVFTLPYLIWRLGNTHYFAPLVVVQIITGILLGPGILGNVFPAYYQFVFNPQVIQSLNGLAWWAVMLFVFIAGIELDLSQAWQHNKESTVTAGLALGVPMVFGAGAALVLLSGVLGNDWIGPNASAWQFVMGVAMSCDGLTHSDFVDGTIQNFAPAHRATHLTLCQPCRYRHLGRLGTHLDGLDACR